MSHPSLGLPPPDFSAGTSAAADRLLAAGTRLAARALEIAADRDPTLTERHDEAALRHLLRDAETLLERIARSMAAADPLFAREFADAIAPLYRRRRVPMDDIVAILEGLRQAIAATLAPHELAEADRAIDEAVAVLRSYRRLAGDARKRNRLISFLYKGA